MTPDFRAHMQHILDADTDRLMRKVQDDLNAAMGVPTGTVTTNAKVSDSPQKTLTFEGLKAMMDKLESKRPKGMLYTHPSVVSQPLKTVRPDLIHPSVLHDHLDFTSVMRPYVRPAKTMTDVCDAVQHAVEQTQLAAYKILCGFDVFVSPNMPTRHIGHWFAEVPPSKNRSKRLWKKLRYGTRRNNKVRQMREEIVMMLGPGDMVVSPATAKQLAVMTQPVKE